MFCLEKKNSSQQQIKKNLTPRQKLYCKNKIVKYCFQFQNNISTISIFEEVIVESPEFPLPYLDINQGYAYMGTMGLIPAHEGFTKAQPFLQKAIELKEDLPETQLNLAWINCWQKWDLKQAKQFRYP